MIGKFGMVGQVKIERADDKTVTFTTRSASNSGDRDECLLRTFTCPISEISTQPFDGAPRPVALQRVPVVRNQIVICPTRLCHLRNFQSQPAPGDAPA